MALNESGVGKIRNFQPISRRISETVQDRSKVIYYHGRPQADALDAHASTIFSKKKLFIKMWSVTWISELLTLNGRSKCRSLRTIIIHQVGYDRDPADIVDLLTAWPLWLYDRDLVY